MKVSIITVTYNSAQFLEDCIISVINQSYCNIEYIIIDGKSTDTTISIIKKHEHQIHKWMSETDRGMYESWNNFYFKQIRIMSPTFIKIKAKGVFRNTYSRPDMMKKGSTEFINKYPNSLGSKEKLQTKENNRTKNSKPLSPRKENEGVRNNSEMNPNKTNQPKIRNNERSEFPREHPIRNRPSENNNSEKKKDLPERNNNRRPRN